MADGFIVRKGGVATEQALAPTITQVATTETSITFTITNNDAETAIIRHRLDDITDEGVIVELATNATSANITVSTLAAGTEFTVFATANVTGKVKSNVTQLAISTNEIPAPTITLVSKTDTSVTFTLKNNSVQTRDVTFGLTTPPTTTTISLASDATSGNQTFSNLDPDTFITLFAQAEGGLIGQLNVTTDVGIVFTAATGGTTLEYDSGGKRFKSHTFTSNGNFVVSTVGDNVDDRNKVDYLIIAGGAAGGASIGGGGGAGGYRTTNGTSGANSSAESKVTVTATTFGVTIGAGGAGVAGRDAGVGTGTVGNNGANSSALGITSTGGGGGDAYSVVDKSTTTSSAQTGGSGGGGTVNDGGATAGAAGTANQGSAGGNGGNAYFAGGGGGASGVGQNGSTQAGNGGGGLGNTLRTNSSETRAGGGGGGTSGGTAGTGGTGGGGNGAAGNANGSNASTNTGSGGGGAGYNGGSNVTSGSGGSGLVVIRYEIAPSV